MHRLAIDWQIPKGRCVDGRKDVISERIFGGVMVVCVWSSDSIPGVIEMHLNKLKRDLEINVNFKLFRNGKQILQKKYLQLMESGSTFIKLRLKGAKVPFQTKPIEASYSLKGFVCRSPYSESVKSSLLGLSWDFTKLLSPNTACIATDVNLKCGSHSTAAHKFVLSARSPVFAAMFANPMRESRENEVVITDIDVSVLQLMLEYMYGGWSIFGTYNVSEVCDLLVAADKYQILSLKADCCNFLKENISLQNVLLLLDRADAITEDLKSFAMDFICQSPEFSAIQNSEAWKSLATKKPVLAIEVLSSLVQTKEEKIKRFKSS